MKIRASLRLIMASKSRETLDAALLRLETMGFSIIRTGRVAVTVEGGTDSFIDILGGDFEPSTVKEKGLVRHINSKELNEVFDLVEITPTPTNF